MVAAEGSTATSEKAVPVTCVPASSASMRERRSSLLLEAVGRARLTNTTTCCKTQILEAHRLSADSFQTDRKQMDSF